jgi:site-specific DNA-methyltransferase (adenine-specific)
MIELFNMDNMDFSLGSYVGACDMVVADYIYESLNFEWVDKYWDMLRPDGGILIAITDYHSSAEYKTFVQELPNANFVNWLTWKNEWGNHGRKQFAQVHDDIIIFSKGSKFRFNPDKAQVTKVTASAKGLNPSGRTTKVATSVITDITLTTGAKERIKDSSGKLIRWQKPKALLQRIMSPFLIQNDVVVDPFMGSGTCGEVCADENWHYFGIEYDKAVFNVAEKRLKPYLNNKEIIPF